MKLLYYNLFDHICIRSHHTDVTTTKKKKTGSGPHYSVEKACCKPMMLKTTRNGTFFHIIFWEKKRRGEWFGGLVDQVMKLNPVQTSDKSQIKSVYHYVLQSSIQKCLTAL